LCLIIPIVIYFLVPRCCPNSNLGKKIIEWRQKIKQKAEEVEKKI
jgi:hypothetical protein